MNKVSLDPIEIIELGHSHHPDIPHHPFHSPFLYSLSRMHGDILYKDGVTTANDLITTGTHTGTHIDALGHVACDGYLHNNTPVAGKQSKTEGLSEYGIDQVKPIITNAVLLDIPAVKGADSLDYLYKITVDDIKETIDKQEVNIKAGDAVFIRTGWGGKFNNPKEFVSLEKGVPGMSLSSVDYLLELGMTLTGSDTTAYEIAEGNGLPVHHRLLVEEGIHIIEMLNLEELAVRQVYHFTFICLPLRIVGGTGSPIRPIAVN